MSTVTNLANDKQTTDSNKTSNQHHREPNWYDKLHVGDLHAHMEEDDDDQSARHSHVTSSASQLWEDAQGRTGTSGESWSAAKHQVRRRWGSNVVRVRVRLGLQGYILGGAHPTFILPSTTLSHSDISSCLLHLLP
eukprot:933386-Amorphochlora_amoeboformis.AAC.1